MIAPRWHTPALTVLIATAWFSLPAAATTFTFGAAVFRSDLSIDQSEGDADDQGSSQYSLSTAAIANFRAQASADTLLGDAIADVEYVWDIPYVVTRNVILSACCPDAVEATFPIQYVHFGITFSGAVGVDEFGGDESAEIFSGISVLSLGSWLDPVSLAGGSRSNTDGTTPVTGTGSSGFLTTVNFADGSAGGEIGFAAPTDYRAWEDLVGPLAYDYTSEQTIVQSFTDTLRISMRVRAVSRPDGFLSTTAGEAIACAGLQSELDSFSLVPNCGSGLTLRGAVGVFGEETAIVAVPEPGTLVLTALATAGLGFWRRTRRFASAGETPR